MFSFSDQVWKEMQMGEVVTILTSAIGHALVKSFSGSDVIQQPFSTGKLFNVSEEPVSEFKSLSVLLHRLEDDAIHTVIRGSLIEKFCLVKSGPRKLLTRECPEADVRIVTTSFICFSFQTWSENLNMEAEKYQHVMISK